MAVVPIPSDGRVLIQDLPDPITVQIYAGALTLGVIVIAFVGVMLMIAPYVKDDRR